MADETSRTPRTVKVEAVHLEARVAHASFFKLSRLGSDFYLDVGFVDPDMAISALKGAEATPAVQAVITHRFGLSRDAFRRLKDSVDDLLQGMKRDGTLIDAGLGDLEDKVRP